MATKQQSRTLYFIKGMKPTKQQLDKAGKMDGIVAFRNVNLFDKNDPIELGITHVTGFVPQKYKDAKGITVVSSKEPGKNDGGSGQPPNDPPNGPATTDTKTTK